MWWGFTLTDWRGRYGPRRLRGKRETVFRDSSGGTVCLGVLGGKFFRGRLL